MIEIMGGDLSLTATGLCVPDGTTYTIKTGGADKGDQRLVVFRKSFTHYLRCWPIELMVLERPGRFKSMDAAVAVGMIHGLARELLAEYRIPYAYIAPAVLKMFATGKGTADKPEMVVAANLARHANLPAITDHNQADAWWLRQMGIWWQFGQAPGLPEIGQMDLNGKGTRHHAVFEHQGAKWPAGSRAAAARTP